MSSIYLDKGKELALAPNQAVSQTFAFIARRGAGKTYAAGVLVEGLLTHHHQVVVFDPIGNWYGLRLSKTAKRSKFNIPVFGGQHADVPLTPKSGKFVATLVVEKGLSVVLDLSGFRKGERKAFVTDFAEQLFHLKKTTRSPIHLVLEEAQLFAPQRAGRDEARMLGAIEDLVRLGRNYGIGASMISQRPQSVNKEVLNQIECLVALQTNGAQERKALRDWAVANTEEDGKSLDARLPALPVGTAIVWSPQWLKCFLEVEIAAKKTFDASATPEVKESGPPAIPALTDAELDKLKQEMQQVTQEAEEKDPAALRRRVRALEKDLRVRDDALLDIQSALMEAGLVQADDPTSPPKRVAELVWTLARTLEDQQPLPVINPEFYKALEGLNARIAKMNEDSAAALAEVGKAMQEAMSKMAQIKVPQAVRVARPAVKPRREPPSDPRATYVDGIANPFGGNKGHTAPSNGAKKSAKLGQAKLKKGARKMLEAMASLGKPATRAQIGMLAGLTPTSGTFSSYLSALRTEDLIVESDRGIELSEAGLDLVGHVPPAKTGDELADLWKPRFKAGGRRMFDALIQFPDGLSRAELAAEAELENGSGTYSSYLSSLRRAGVIEEMDGHVKLREEFLS